MVLFDTICADYIWIFCGNRVKSGGLRNLFLKSIPVSSSP